MFEEDFSHKLSKYELHIGNIFFYIISIIYITDQYTTEKNSLSPVVELCSGTSLQHHKNFT
jgi:hypothetical protein